MTILVTGGAGFIGVNFVRDWLMVTDEQVINFDKLTYAGNLESLKDLSQNSNHQFIRGDISDRELVASILTKYKPRVIVNFAAESHVDRSIHDPEAFIMTNIVGTYRLIDEVLDYWKGLTDSFRERFRFLHVSTDEVYGSLEESDSPFIETTAYMPNSPYSATKASSDHIVRAYHHTYGLPVLTTNCSNNYGPYQFPEKLIPLMICNAINGNDLPVYGDGKNIRDWLYVGDHCSAIREVIAIGRVGETYNIGGWSEKTNLDVIHTLCALLDELYEEAPGKPYEELITFIPDRPGHDRRYAIDASKIRDELGWMPCESFESGMRKTVQWYLNNMSWIEGVMSGEYRKWLSINYSQKGVGQ